MINQYYDNHADSFQNRQEPGSTPPAKKPDKKKKSKGRFKAGLGQMKTRSMVFLVIGCLLVSAACGFGGSMLQGALGNKSSVVYQTAGHSSTSDSTTTTTSTDKVLTTAEISAKDSPTIVSITTEIKSSSSSFGSLFGGSSDSSSGTSEAAGSGVIITADGYIITCNHVVSDASKVTVTTSDNKTYNATVVGTDSQTDIALLKIDASGLTPAVFGDSSKLTTGENAVAIGNSLGELSGTVTEGIISSTNRTIELEGEQMTLIQTSATINPGNSGGGLFNQYGELIGIVVAKSSGTDVEGVGFAIPINNVTSIIDTLKTNGYVTGRPSLGVSLVDVSDAQTAMQYGVNEKGVYISEVTSNSAASKAGLKSGDRIVSVDGTDVSSATDVKSAIEKKAVGDTVKIKVSRNNQTVEVSVTLGEATK